MICLASEWEKRKPLVRRDGFVNGKVNGNELAQAGNLHHCVALPRQSSQRETLALVSAMHENLHQRSHARRVQIMDTTHIQDQLWSTLGSQGLKEIVYGFLAKRAFQACNQPLLVGCR